MRSLTPSLDLTVGDLERSNFSYSQIMEPYIYEQELCQMLSLNIDRKLYMGVQWHHYI